MGRYYDGDINGKFWFAVQSSHSADRFGVKGQTNYLDYYFGEDNLEDVQNELKYIENTLGVYKSKMDDFFKDNHSYTDEILSEYIGLGVSETKKLLKDYADYGLGKKIEKSIIENGQCFFNAEL